MGLSLDHTIQAINLGVAPNIALHQTRAEILSHWKGCAYANASRNAIFATLLAERGLTGPAPIFEGENGFFKVVLNGEYELDKFGGNGVPFKISECTIKRFPLGLYSQTVVQAALETRDQMPNFNVDDVKSVNIRTLGRAINIMANDEEKWHPKTRETADHSMPYTTAVALTYGFVNQSHFDDEYINNQQLLELTSRVTVEESEEANRRVPEAMLCYMDIVTKSGEIYSSEVPYHKGHYKNPMTDMEVEHKFRTLVKDYLTAGQTDQLLDKLWNLETVNDIGDVLRLTKI
jgi:2-methylcitrate dehydratase